jgi:hypothetical protein
MLKWDKYYYVRLHQLVLAPAPGGLGSVFF